MNNQSAKTVSAENHIAAAIMMIDNYTVSTKKQSQNF